MMSACCVDASDVHKSQGGSHMKSERGPNEERFADEMFSQQRMDRCMTIHRQIMDRWQETNTFDITVRATEPIAQIEFCEWRKLYFALGVDQNLTEVPFLDL